MTKKHPTKAEAQALRIAQPPAADDSPMTTNELADFLKVSRITPIIWRREGKGPPFIRPEGSDARLVRYLKPDVIAWLECNRRNAPADNDARRFMRSRAKAGRVERVEADCVEHGVDIDGDRVREGVHSA